MRSGRVAVTRGSFWRRQPAAELRGFANGGLPAATRPALSSSKSASRKNTSPRTSISSGTGNSSALVSRSGMSAEGAHVSVTSSPVRPSPRVSARTSRPFS